LKSGNNRLRAGRSQTEIIRFFGYPRVTQDYIWYCG